MMSDTISHSAEAYDKHSAEQGDSICKIEADSIIAEIVDKDTGTIFRRNLPVNYFENSNGIVLSGETLEGTPVQIVFYSAAALARINELLGKGPESPRCGQT